MPYKIDQVWAFNDRFTCLFKRDQSLQDGVVVLVDVSHSMNGRRRELKAAFSAAIALDPDVPRIDLPTLNNHTRLYGCCEWLMPDLIGTEKKMLVITDGDDTHHADFKIKTAVDADGHWVFTELEYPAHAHCLHAAYEAYAEKRRAAILDYFAACDIEWFLVGVGDEVKELCAKASKKRNMTVAAIADQANVSEIVAIVHTAVRNPRRKLVAKAPEDGAEEPPPVIYQADTPSVVAAMREEGFKEGVRKVDEAASKMAFGECLPLERIKDMFAEAEKKAGLDKDPEELINYRRRAVAWFLKLAVDEPDGARLPGALLGAQWSSIYTGPEGHQDKAWYRSMNVLLGKLRDAGVLCDGKSMPEKWSQQVQGVAFVSPPNCAMYAAGMGVRPAVVRELLDDNYWAPIDVRLLLRGEGGGKDKKRKAEDEAVTAPEPVAEAEPVAVPESQADAVPHPAILGIKAPRLGRQASVASVASVASGAPDA